MVNDGMDEVRRAEALSGIVRSQRQVAAALSALDSSDEKDRRAAMTALEHAHAGLDDALAEFYGVARMAGVDPYAPSDTGRALKPKNMPPASSHPGGASSIRLGSVEDRLGAIEQRLRLIENHLTNDGG